MRKPTHHYLQSALLLAAGCTLALPAFGASVVWPKLMVQLHGSGKAFLVDPATDKVVAALDTGKGATLGTTTPDGRKVYVAAAAEGERMVYVIDLAERKVIKKLDTGARPKHPLASPDGRWVGVNHWGLDNGKLRVSFLDAKTDEIAKEVEVPVKYAPVGVTSMHNSWSKDSRYFFTVDRVDNELVVIDTKDWSVREIKVSSKPHYPVPSPDGSELWLVVEGSRRDNPPQVEVYDLKDPALPLKLSLKMPLEGEDVLEGHHGNFTQDGKYFLILNRGPGGQLTGREVAVFDAKTKKLVTRFQTGSTGIGHAYNSPDGRYTLITNYGNNVVTVVDLKKMAPVKDLTIGAGRMGHAAYTKDGRFSYISNEGDGKLYKLDMNTLTVVGEIDSGAGKGAGQVFNVWTNVFEEMPR